MLFIGFLFGPLMVAKGAFSAQKILKKLSIFIVNDFAFHHFLYMPFMAKCHRAFSYVILAHRKCSQYEIYFTRNSSMLMENIFVFLHFGHGQFLEAKDHVALHDGPF